LRQRRNHLEVALSTFSQFMLENYRAEGRIIMVTHIACDHLLHRFLENYLVINDLSSPLGFALFPEDLLQKDLVL
jgi:hypothetical protein